MVAKDYNAKVVKLKERFFLVNIADLSDISTQINKASFIVD